MDERPEPDPVVRAYLADVDRTLIAKNLTLTPDRLRGRSSKGSNHRGPLLDVLTNVPAMRANASRIASSEFA